ncbi:GNAT family N-acetyltransferase [Desertivirga arenae]|uniref:GNAT family N-acetyltransferase n=1 Tax=Desertivirga arenae TaxID=2810309 RepID=UPI001A97231C|nr:GNAT family N-acetyltransferase [Pedobacter sp. SYSU D00823]
MNEIFIPNREELPELIELWETSVRSTHHFLSEEDIVMYKELLSSILPVLELYSLSDSTGKTGFIGISEDTVQALFIHPEHMGKGLGMKLMNFAMLQKGVRKVEVNEQNTRAFEFYKKLGFVVIGRTPLDGMNRPYPILSLQLVNEEQTRSQN